jgi:hypothetical protein
MMTMSDFDTRRIGEIHQLELRINALQAELAERKKDAEKWTPKVGSSMDAATGNGKITMHFGGKAFAAELPAKALQFGTLTGVTTDVIELLCVHLVGARLKEVVEPEVSKLLQGVQATRGAGKW